MVICTFSLYHVAIKRDATNLIQQDMKTYYIVYLSASKMKCVIVQKYPILTEAIRVHLYMKKKGWK